MPRMPRRTTPEEFRKKEKIKNVFLVIVISMITIGAIFNLLAWNGIGLPYTTDIGIYVGSIGIGLGWLGGKILN